ncbi:MAG: hypothetical protein GWO00_21480, partial [Gemmatimonadetes bacterium]|nr:hypothetical protein [Gemmatimonadota bacterium]NIT89649.1 hypothetical protein [Gemmatimonadota bacterium]NIV63764.1 hypothetical protein [Gemmatimonadota bacterium]NIW66500.1 hypothetical protein [Gemmatimonadota bacterium]NIX41782.1 hypothetical protein [Gemmatimonadota bacterium]
MLAGLACADATRTELHTGPPASDQEHFCAWFGDARDGVLYFGEAAFWSELRRTGGPEGEAARSGPVRIGRFDLRERRLLDPLPVAASEPSGSWDVLAHPNGRVYFSTFFGLAGSVDPRTGAVVRFGPETRGLNELTRGDGDRILATRYAVPGAVVVLDPEGRVLETFELPPPPGYR